MSPHYAETLRHLYVDQRLTIKEIARLQNVSAETLRRSLIEAGVPRRPRGAPTGKYLPAGGRIRDKDGYELARVEEHPYGRGGYVLTHRLVLEAALGRYLDPAEVVAHRDGDPGNNAFDNLVLYGSASELAHAALAGNTRAKGDVGNPKRRSRRSRTPDQILFALGMLQGSLLRDIRRSDLQPPQPSYRAVARAFGSWQAGVSAALKVYGPNGLRGGDWTPSEFDSVTRRKRVA